jgi:hypothetical protein
MNTLFMAALVVEALFAAGFIIAPGAMLGPFGVTLNGVATTFARLFGSALLSFPVLLWSARKSGKPEFKKGVVNSLFVYYTASTVLLVLAQTAGQMNVLGWSVIGIHGVFLLWFGYFIVK